MKAEFFQEPLLEFGSGQRVEHPQDGLFLYGPVQVKGSPAVVSVGAVGTRSGIDLLTRWLKELAGRIPAQNPDALHTSAWPGFQSSFGARLETEPTASIVLGSTAIKNAASISNRTEAVRTTVSCMRIRFWNTCARRKCGPMYGASSFPKSYSPTEGPR